MYKTGHPVMGKYGPGHDTPGFWFCSVEGDGGTGGGTGTGGTGGGTSDGGTGTGGDGTTQVVDITAPWAAAGEKPWTIGEKNVPWHAAIPEAPVRELMGQKNYANPAVLATAYYNLNKHVSGADNVIQVPPENATPEQRDAFYAKLGRPVDPTKYDLAPAFAEDVAVDPNFKPHPKLEEFGRKTAFKYGMTNTQAIELAKDYRGLEREMMKEAFDADKVANDAALEKLKGVYGANYNSHLAAGTRVYQSLGLDSETVAAIERNMGAAPLVDLLCRIGMKSAEPNSFVGGGSGNGSGDAGTMSAEGAAAEITRLNSDTAFQAVYTNRNDPGNREAIERMNRLYAKAGDKAPV